MRSHNTPTCLMQSARLSFSSACMGAAVSPASCVRVTDWMDIAGGESVTSLDSGVGELCFCVTDWTDMAGRLRPTLGVASPPLASGVSTGGGGGTAWKPDAAGGASPGAAAATVLPPIRALQIPGMCARHQQVLVCSHAWSPARGGGAALETPNRAAGQGFVPQGLGPNQLGDAITTYAKYDPALAASAISNSPSSVSRVFLLPNHPHAVQPSAISNSPSSCASSVFVFFLPNFVPIQLTPGGGGTAVFPSLPGRHTPAPSMPTLQDIVHDAELEALLSATPRDGQQAGAQAAVTSRSLSDTQEDSGHHEGRGLTPEQYQTALDEVWTMLEAPLGVRLEMAIKYTTPEFHPRLDRALHLWRKCAKAIVARERLLRNFTRFEEIATDPRAVARLTAAQLKEREEELEQRRRRFYRKFREHKSRCEREIGRLQAELQERVTFQMESDDGHPSLLCVVGVGVGYDVILCKQGRGYLEKMESDDGHPSLLCVDGVDGDVLCKQGREYLEKMESNDGHSSLFCVVDVGYDVVILYTQGREYLEKMESDVADALEEVETRWAELAADHPALLRGPEDDNSSSAGSDSYASTPTAAATPTTATPKTPQPSPFSRPPQPPSKCLTALADDRHIPPPTHHPTPACPSLRRPDRTGRRSACMVIDHTPFGCPCSGTGRR
ncbi:hypothetical protein PAPYR_543 [Paratrimastix pyriformis]|uniref:Uncharacterized protein n=1 Tax=Paratrimastix pyriformis TaxID=342808 RepID=A0ABQ8UTV8_9EUKA|nr:hypothetical protein PAPYR_543 [Paratrimastix pyriformis]